MKKNKLVTSSLWAFKPFVVLTLVSITSLTLVVMVSICNPDFKGLASFRLSSPYFNIDFIIQK